MTTSAIEDATRLLPWIESNSLVLNDPQIEARLVAALAGQVDPELACRTPLLRHCNPDVPAVPLLDLVLRGTVDHLVTQCDRCDGDVEERGGGWTLLVPMGGSVVVFRSCRFCQLVLNDEYTPLVWGTNPPAGHLQRATDAGWGVRPGRT